MEGAPIRARADGLPVWEGVTVRFDSEPGEATALSEWELERPAGQARGHAGRAAAVATAGAGTGATLSKEARGRLARCLEAALAEDEAAYFFGDRVTSDVAPGYDEAVPFQSYLRLALARLRGGFYRHAAALRNDLDLIALNCREYNGADAPLTAEAVAFVRSVKSRVDRALA